MGIGVHLAQSSTRNRVVANALAGVSGGAGGIEVGAPNVGFGVFLDGNSLDNEVSDTNTLDGDPVVYRYAVDGEVLSGYRLMAASNPTNLGKIVVVQSRDVVLRDSEVGTFHAEAGRTAATGGVGTPGETGSGILLLGCESVTVQGTTVRDIVGGQGGTGYTDRTSAGFGGAGSGIRVVDSARSRLVDNLVTAVTGGPGGGNHSHIGGQGGVAVGIHLAGSTGSELSGNVVLNTTGGVGGRGGPPGTAYGIYLAPDSLDTTIDDTNTVDGDPIVYLHGADGELVQGYTLTAESNPTNLGKIALVGCSNVQVRDNEVAGFAAGDDEPGAGVLLSGCQTITVADNVVRDVAGGAGAFGAGIRVLDSTGSTFSGNTVQAIEGSPGAGVYLGGSTGNTFEDNTIFGILGTGSRRDELGFGLYLEPDSLANTIDDTNTVDDVALAYLHAASGTVLEGLCLTGEARPTNLGKVALVDCDGVTVRDSELGRYRAAAPSVLGAGVFVSGGQDVTLSGNLVWDVASAAGGPESAGVWVEGSTGLTVEDNTITEVAGENNVAGAGIRVVDSPDAALHANELSVVSGSAVHVSGSNSLVSTNDLVYEIAGGNARGFHVEGASLDVRIASATVHGVAGTGVWAGADSGLVLDSSIVAECSGRGVVNAHVSYSDVWDNTGGDLDNCSTGDGVISLDPLFQGIRRGELSLGDGSPAIDGGDPVAPCANEPTAGDGTCRIDMGHLGNSVCPT